MLALPDGPNSGLPLTQSAVETLFKNLRSQYMNIALLLWWTSTVLAVRHPILNMWNFFD